MASIISRTFNDGRLEALDFDGTLIVGRNNPPNMFSKDEVENGIEMKAVSKEQLRIERCNDASADFTITRIGKGRSVIRRSGGRSEPLEENASVLVFHGDIIYMHSRDERLAFAVNIDCSARDTPKPAAPMPANQASSSTSTGPASGHPVASQPIPVVAELPAAPPPPKTSDVDMALGPAKRPRSDEATVLIEREEPTFCALRIPWRPVGADEMVQATVTLHLDRTAGHVTAHACDGLRLMRSAEPVRCTWRSLSSTGDWSTSLKQHSLYLDRWQLTLSPPPPPMRDTSHAECVVIDLVSAPAPTVGGGMLLELLEHMRGLRRMIASQDEANAALEEKVAQREAELESEAEALRAREVAQLSAFLPILIAKERKLEALEKEAVEKDVMLDSL